MLADKSTFTGKLYDALELAAKAHGEQKRKGTEIPYITHPVAAAMILLKHGFAEEMVIAALLHDTVEDTAINLEDIRRQFGERVAELVEGCSERDKSAPWEERKSVTLAHLSRATQDVAAVSCADKLHNIISIARDHELHGEAVWERFNRGRDKVAWYYQGLVNALARSLGEESALYGEFKCEVERLFGEGEGAEDGAPCLDEQGSYRNTKPVKLTELVSEMEMQFESMHVYLNLESGEFVTVTTEELGAAEEEEEALDPEEWEDDEMQAARDIVDNFEKYEALPDSFEIHEYEIMEGFIETLEDERLYEIMDRAIRGKGAFRRFKDNIQEHGIADDWYRFRAEALKEIAIEWCKHNRIRYIG